jgi:hypothetical protein
MVTIGLVILIVILSFAGSRNKQIESARLLGQVIGSVCSWPFFLLLIYAVSRKMREKYSGHTVINYGLAIDTVILLILWLAAKPS